MNMVKAKNRILPRSECSGELQLNEPAESKKRVHSHQVLTSGGIFGRCADKRNQLFSRGCFLSDPGILPGASPCTGEKRARMLLANSSAWLS